MSDGIAPAIDKGMSHRQSSQWPRSIASDAALRNWHVGDVRCDLRGSRLRLYTEF